MGKKGKKTRWRRLPIGGTEEEGGLSLEPAPPTTDPHRITFNEDEYTKITTPRQDVLFKKGYFGRKRTPNPSPSDTQEVHSGDSVESESYVSEEPQYAYPTGYMDPNGVYYVNGNTFETYDPYTGTVTVVVGPPAQYPGGTPVLAALPCQPVPLQPVEWFNPPSPWCYSYNRRKRYSTDSQNCSAQSSESTGPPGSPQEPVDEGACAVFPPQYVYPGYMFGPPIYNMNGVTVQGVIPQPVPLPPDLSAVKRRKKRRRRRRGGVTDDGSESSCCEEPLTCDMPGCQSETSSDAICQSGASSDAGAGPGSSSSKANSDSGINTDPTPNSGSNSPPLHIANLAQVTESVNNIQFECLQPDVENHTSVDLSGEKDQLITSCVSQESHIFTLFTDNENIDVCMTKEEDKNQEAITPEEEISEEISTAEDDLTPNFHSAVPEFSSPDSTLSCLSSPSATKDLFLNEQLVSNVDVTPEEMSESCQSVSETVVSIEADHNCDVYLHDNLNHQPLSSGCFEPSICDQIIEVEIRDSEKLHLCVEEEIIENLDKEIEKSVTPEIQLLIDDYDLGQSSTDIESSAISVEDNLILTQHSQEEDLIEKSIEPKYLAIASTSLETCDNSEMDNPHLNFPTCVDTIAPVPPPRRKRSLCRAADKVATRVVDEAIKEGIEEAASVRLRSPMPITEAVTRWLNSQGNSPLTCIVFDSESEDDEGIEVGEELTDQKNVRGNPFLVSSRSGSRQRVAKDCESIDSSAGEWDMWDSSHTRDMCDPSRSVDKYYRLGADDGVGDKVSPSVYKTALHIRHSGPFPCGVCCIIQ